MPTARRVTSRASSTTAQVDSINMYNGQLTVPIALGPSYPVGPKLRVQVALTYNSRSTDYGAPSTLEQSPYFFFRPLAGNPSLGSGWELTLGAIKTCKHGQIVGNCYFAADGSQHMFGGGPKVSDALPLYVSPSSGRRSLRHVGRRRKSLRLRQPTSADTTTSASPRATPTTSAAGATAGT